MQSVHAECTIGQSAYLSVTLQIQVTILEMVDFHRDQLTGQVKFVRSCIDDTTHIDRTCGGMT